jgi:hypothetical protein
VGGGYDGEDRVRNLQPLFSGQPRSATHETEGGAYLAGLD